MVRSQHVAPTTRQLPSYLSKTGTLGWVVTAAATSADPASNHHQHRQPASRATLHHRQTQPLNHTWPPPSSCISVHCIASHRAAPRPPLPVLRAARSCPPRESLCRSRSTRFGTVAQPWHRQSRLLRLIVLPFAIDHTAKGEPVSPLQQGSGVLSTGPSCHKASPSRRRLGRLSCDWALLPHTPVSQHHASSAGCRLGNLRYPNPPQPLAQSPRQLQQHSYA